jgi:hypothetical protein
VARLIAGEIVDPGTGMGVDDAKRSLLVLQINENAHQHDVLDDVGKAAGMKGVTVVHVISSTPRQPIEKEALTYVSRTRCSVLQTRGPRISSALRRKPHSASKTRVNALMARRRRALTR